MSQGLKDCYLPKERVEDGPDQLAHVYRYILSDNWGKGTPLPNWTNLWAQIIEPELAKS